jgi:hypothetical protein
VAGYLAPAIGVLLAYVPLILLALWLKAGAEEKQEV